MKGRHCCGRLNFADTDAALGRSSWKTAGDLILYVYIDILEREVGEALVKVTQKCSVFISREGQSLFLFCHKRKVFSAIPQRPTLYFTRPCTVGPLSYND